MGVHPRLGDPTYFKDHHVFYIGTASSLMDLRPSPFYENDPGGHLHATATDNLLNNDFIYYYPQNFHPDYYNVKPEDFTEETIEDEAVTFLPFWTYENGCPSTEEPGGGDIGKDGLRGDLTTAGENITTTAAILNVLVDGGDTEALNLEVETSVPPETMQVYNELMGSAFNTGSSSDYSPSFPWPPDTFG